MLKTLITLPKIQLVGLKARTNTAAEMKSENPKIGPLIQEYFSHNIPGKIPNRKKPGRTFCVYTEYEKEESGDYTFFVGEEVDSLEFLPEDLHALSIPIQTYAKFTTQPGSMPSVVIEAWQKIWQLSAVDFGGPRAYKADFEIYDERAVDPQQTIVDVYVGIQQIPLDS